MNQNSSLNIKTKHQMLEQNSKQVYCTVFMFVNSGSGSGLGTRIINQEIQKITFEIPIKNQKDIKLIDVHFINMRKNKQKGFQELKKFTNANKKVISVICGGDGTIMWVIECYVKFDIDPMLTPIAIIPLGTGNDFSRNLNWGVEKTMLIQYNFRSLKKLIRKWLHAEQCEFDLWEVTAEVFENGKIQKISNGQNTVLPKKEIKKDFANYFSFGIDGKIGYSFDRHRTNSRLGNLAVYGGIGVIKAVTRTKTIDELVESFWISPDANNVQKLRQSGVEVFRSKKIIQNEDKKQKEEEIQYIPNGQQNILFLNIDSYTGGVKDIWKNAKEVFKKNVNQRFPAVSSDGKIQVVSFGSGAGIAMERSFGGFAMRIAQSEGPFRFNFKKYPNDQKHRTYLQIDGQFIRFTHPKSIVIKKSNLVANGKIKVLKNDPDFIPYTPQ